MAIKYPGLIASDKAEQDHITKSSKVGAQQCIIGWMPGMPEQATEWIEWHRNTQQWIRGV